MRNTKEVRAILVAIHCVNYTSENRDTDIHKIVDYASAAFRREYEFNHAVLRRKKQGTNYARDYATAKNRNPIPKIFRRI